MFFKCFKKTIGLLLSAIGIGIILALCVPFYVFVFLIAISLVVFGIKCIFF